MRGKNSVAAKQYAETNPVLGMKIRNRANRVEIIWADDAIDTFVKGASDRVGRILLAATETGLRPGDLAQLSRAHIRSRPQGRTIVIRTTKRSRYAAIPVTERMGALIDATRRDRLHILATARGGTFTNLDRLGRKVGEWRDELGLRKELHLYDAPVTAVKMIETYAAMHPDPSGGVLLRLDNVRQKKL